MSETARPKPMPPKKPLVEAEVKVISMDNINLTQAEIEKFGSYFLDEQTPLEMHGEPVVIEKVEKPKYVLKPHLTERPLKGHEGLLALRKQLDDSAPKRGQRRNNKEKK